MYNLISSYTAMPLLTSKEAHYVSDSFLLCLYGDEMFKRWKDLKEDMKFVTEREYVSWLVDVATHYIAADDATDVAYKVVGQNQVKVEQQHEPSASSLVESKPNPMSGISHGERDRAISDTSYDAFNMQQPYMDESKIQHNISYTPQSTDYCNTGRGNVPDVVVDEAAPEIEIVHEDDISGRDEECIQGATPTLNIDFCDNVQASLFATGYQYGMDLDGNTNSGTPHRGSSHSHTKTNECPHCSYSSNRRDLVKKHILAVHKLNKPFTCPYCDYKFAQKATLDGHLIHKHGQESNYRCAKCGKYFLTPSKCKSHSEHCSGQSTIVVR